MPRSLPAPSLFFLTHQHTDQAYGQRRMQMTGVLTHPLKHKQPVHHSFVIDTNCTALLFDIFIGTFSLFVFVRFRIHGHSFQRFQSGLYPEKNTPQLFQSSFQEAFEGVMRSEQVICTHVWISAQQVLDPLFEQGHFCLQRKRKPDVLEFFTSSHS